MSESDAVLLTKPTTILSERLEDSLDWLNLVTESNYSDVKGKARAVGPRYFAGNYSNFKQARRELFNLTSYSRDTLTSRSLITTSTPDTALEAWVQCMRDDFSGKPGFEGEESIYDTRPSPADPIRGTVAVYFSTAAATGKGQRAGRRLT